MMGEEGRWNGPVRCLGAMSGLGANTRHVDTGTWTAPKCAVVTTSAVVLTADQG
jgi:hypothetical protein